MKHFPFDLTVLALFIAVAAWQLLGVRNSPLVLECDATYDYTNQTSIPMQYHQQLCQQQRDIFEIGDMVEVYERKIYQEYAFFAKIASNGTHHDGSIKYEIRTGPDRDKLFQDIDSSNIRAHEPIEFKRHVMCRWLIDI